MYSNEFAAGKAAGASAARHKLANRFREHGIPVRKSSGPPSDADFLNAIFTRIGDHSVLSGIKTQLPSAVDLWDTSCANEDFEMAKTALALMDDLVTNVLQEAPQAIRDELLECALDLGLGAQQNEANEAFWTDASFVMGYAAEYLERLACWGTSSGTCSGPSKWPP